MHKEGEPVRNDNSDMGKSPQRTFVDVIRKGGKRRGYITVRKHDDGRLEVGYSLCELRDRFSGVLGLDIALKRGARWIDKSYVRVHGNGTDMIINFPLEQTVVVPHTIAGRIVADVAQASGIFGEVNVPEWVRELANNNQ